MNGSGRFFGVWILGAALAAPTLALAQSEPVAQPLRATTVPIPPPPPEIDRSLYLSNRDYQLLSKILEQAEEREWAEVLAATPGLSDPLARKIATWRRLIARDSRPTLAEIIAFKRANPDWPRQYLLDMRAEEALLIYGAPDRDLIAWFSENPPETGDGRLAYAEALLSAGQQKSGAYWVQRAWVENDFPREAQREILETYGRYLPAKAHQRRLDRLLFDNRSGDARATAALIGEEAQAITNARLKLMGGRMEIASALEGLQDPALKDPGLIFQQARSARLADDLDTAIPLLLSVPPETVPQDHRGTWWTQRQLAARAALEDGRAREAYDLARAHGHEEGVDFAEGEFLAGWIALQYLGDPQLARPHFERLRDGVTTPISMSRALYWLGRTEAAAGNRTQARMDYEAAAAYATTFYGQLARGELGAGRDPITLYQERPAAGSARTRFENRELVRAVALLNDQGESWLVWLFATHLADTLEDPAELASLAAMARDFGMPHLSVRIAKTGATRGIDIPAYAYPTDVMPGFEPVGENAAERPLVFALSRHESEFNPEAVSHAGARGLMQLMPGTAREQAELVGLPYDLPRLTSDPAYNAALGSAHLGDLIARFNGSYVMSLAAYNAGARRVEEWVERFGDPRSPQVDAIDWVENIPYSETRNYVQRVMENLHIYRSRLGETAGAGTPAQDLERGRR